LSELPTAEALPPKSAPERLTVRLVQLPRLARIGFAALFAVSTTLLLTPLVDGIYMRNFFDFNTRILPAIVSTVVGIVVYFVGWMVFVGYAGETMQARRVVFFYFVFGCLMLAAVLLLLITGALDLTL
jgi:hypothetical protein